MSKSIINGFELNYDNCTYVPSRYEYTPTAPSYTPVDTATSYRSEPAAAAATTPPSKLLPTDPSIDTDHTPSGMTTGAWIDYQLNKPYHRLYRDYNHLKLLKTIRDPRIKEYEERVKQYQLELAARAKSIHTLTARVTAFESQLAALQLRLARLTADNLRLVKLTNRLNKK